MFRSREELAWAAGFFEGEGSFISQRKGADRRPVPILYISQVNREPLDRFVAALGFPVTGGQYQEVRQGACTIWRYRIHRWEHVQAAVCYLWPWLSAKRRQEALRMLREGAWRPRRAGGSRWG